MKVFSIPVVSGICPKESSGNCWDTFYSNPGGQTDGGPTRIVAHDEAFVSVSYTSEINVTRYSSHNTLCDRSTTHHIGAPRCMEPAGSPAPSTPSAASSILDANSCRPETRLNNPHGASSRADVAQDGDGASVGGGFGDVPEALLLPQLEETDDQGIGAADWLDATHALLNVVVHGPCPPSSRN